jgi:hypothetical protein
MVVDQRLQTSLGSLPEDEVTAWNQRLERHRRDCGCRAGSLIMLSVTGAWISYSFLSPAAGRSWQRSIGMGLLVLLVSGFVGKLVGLTLARVRFNLTVRSLRKRTCAETVV